MLAIVSACGSGTSGKASVAPTSTAAGTAAATATATAQGTETPVTLTVQYPKADNPVSVANADKGIAMFLEKYKNVTIKKNDWQYSPNEIGIKMAAHQAPSAFSTYATEGKMLVEHGWAADLSPFMAEYDRAGEFNKSLSEVFTVNGKLYGIPMNAYITGVILNKKLFEEKNVPLPPLDWTWDDLYNAAKAIADPAKGIAGFAPMGKGNEAGWNWTNFLYQAGGEAQQVADGKVKSTFQSDAGVKAMEFYKKLRWEANALPQNWALNYSDTYNLFKQGRVAIVLGSNNNIEDAVNNGGMNKDDIVLMPMPSMEKGGKQVGVLGGNFLIVNPQESTDVQKYAFIYNTWSLFSDTYVNDVRRDLESRKSKGQILVPNVADYWNPGSEFDKKVQALYGEFPDTVYKLDQKVKERTKGLPEPAYSAQDNYSAITNVIQEVLTDKNADVKALLGQAATNFDKDFLSKVTP